VAEIGARRWAAAVRIDQPDDDGDRPDGAETPDAVEARDAGATARFDSDSDSDDADRDRAAPRARAGEHEAYRARVDAVFREYAIDQAYDRVREIESGTVTPAMKRIEAEDPGRRLAGLEHSLKGKDRLTEKVDQWMSAQADLTAVDAISLVKDAIRYTFVYGEAAYSAGVRADCDRLESSGFTPVDRQNSWKDDQYKGINSRWREPESGMLFEMQFHTQESIDAKELTHPAYERIRDTKTPPDEVRQLREYQRDVCAGITIPSEATEIPDYNHLQGT
jgi:hypothetical protein